MADNLSQFAALGFTEWETGGGCTALRLDVTSASYLLITAGDNVEAPTNETKTFGLGLYSEDGEQQEFVGGDMSHVLLAIDRIRKLKK